MLYLILMLACGVVKHSANPDIRFIPELDSIRENFTEELPQLMTRIADLFVSV